MKYDRPPYVDPPFWVFDRRYSSYSLPLLFKFDTLRFVPRDSHESEWMLDSKRTIFHISIRRRIHPTAMDRKHFVFLIDRDAASSPNCADPAPRSLRPNPVQSSGQWQFSFGSLQGPGDHLSRLDSLSALGGIHQSQHWYVDLPQQVYT